MPDVVVVGGGISGLACAWRLQHAGLNVLVIEASHQVGGVIRSHRIDEYLVESGPNTILPTPATVGIVQEAGLEAEVVTAPSNSSRYIFVGGKLRKVPFSVLSPKGLSRALLEPFIRRSDQTEETLESFFKRRFGKEVHDRLAAPFVTGIYAGDTERLSLQATFPHLSELEKRFGSVLLGSIRGQRDRPRSKLSSFRSGMESLPLGLAKGLEISCGVTEVHIDEGLRVGWNREEIRPKAVVLAVPAHIAANLTEVLSPALADLLKADIYASMVVVAMSVDERNLAKPIKGLGFLIPRTEKLHILGTLFSSNLFPGRAPPGRVLLTSFLGGMLEPEVFDWSEDLIDDTVSAELRQVLSLSSDPEGIATFRWKRAIPQYRPGHKKWVKNVSSLLKKVPGLFLTGNYFDGVSVPGSIERGLRSATEVIEYIRRKK